MDTEKYWCELPESSAETIRLFPKETPHLKMDVSGIEEDSENKPGNYFQAQLEEFADNITQQKGITVDGRAAARSIKLIEKMYQNRLSLDEPWLVHNIQRGGNV